LLTDPIFGKFGGDHGHPMNGVAVVYDEGWTVFKSLFGCTKVSYISSSLCGEPWCSDQPIALEQIVLQVNWYSKSTLVF